MPVTPNTLLQASVQAKPKAAVNSPAAAPDLGDRASSFAQVFAKQAPDKAAAAPEPPVKSARDNASSNTVKKDTGNQTPATSEPTVADSGKPLPADKPVSADDETASDDNADSAETPVADAAPVDPSLDPGLLPDVTVPVATIAPEPAPVATTETQVSTAVAAPLAPLVASAQAAVVPEVDPAFDPEADPLDALPALRLAMEQGGHVSASSQAQSKTAASASLDGEPTSAQTFAAGMASMLTVQADQNSTDSGSQQGGDKAFGGLISEGLKDLSAASSDTRVDDFANRLAALTQAATPKTANAVPVNQPIAMNQSGWTEEVVNRVMYLSSVNLKAADIQLQPAELGRLDIRVNMVPDQQTQVTFMSAHSGVREALEGQMHRLRDSFAQQGMGQVDVSVSDQSRGSQNQGQQAQQQAQAGRTTSSGGRVDSADEHLPASVAEVAASTTSVIGSSAVDYYA
ncbi:MULTISPECIES: flagellar hook-length control protein FliK [unclassified Pseudomonas]|uniref:flagellar hook-length control protein FliK n=1 Tax=unclassified Pseudomonas TaxID=196821 RepID=UPI000876D9DA|nr:MULTISPECIES: flagellar hook-length control protein FliK [unclassified Pseudomonas]SCZ28138.1 flagellar hook-length control protein FliK [Pseudomonas sp. NFACC44-2]SDA76134.1 flagellar hook-length control protein FliK [Pseudomonas sp. NFACC51]SEJ29160.1 flagellar hook-length control protein FliK [Pseudomonas sp. NFACC07-1]SFH45538.1 flagellar hook-length control protein FliK [Pseudomonas sp. NFACC54]SFT14582.1 flagellar hook-length control protein FliK [Pseudomonas sp. NFACC48-1]